MFMSHRWDVWNGERRLLKAIGDSSPQWSAILKTFESNKLSQASLCRERECAAFANSQWTVMLQEVDRDPFHGGRTSSFSPRAVLRRYERASAAAHARLWNDVLAAHGLMPNCGLLSGSAKAAEALGVSLGTNSAKRSPLPGVFWKMLAHQLRADSAAPASVDSDRDGPCPVIQGASSVGLLKSLLGGQIDPFTGIRS